MFRLIRIRSGTQPPVSVTRSNISSPCRINPLALIGLYMFYRQGRRLMRIGITLSAGIQSLSTGLRTPDGPRLSTCV